MLPYFGYFSTLAIYYSKTALQRMCNYFNLCLAKLFRIKNNAHTNEELNEHNNYLEKFGLNTFEHRLVAKMASFTYKIYNNMNAPTELHQQIQPKISKPGAMIVRDRGQSTLTHKTNNINSRHTNVPPQPRAKTAVSTPTFSLFFTKFITNLLVEDIKQRFCFFNKIVFNNINLLILKFVFFFSKFDLKNKNFDNLWKKR